MKVDVITRHSVPNYGSLLQTYATQKTLNKLGYDCDIIDYTKYEERYENLADTLLKTKKWNKNAITRRIYKLVQTKNYSHMYKKFFEYRKELIKETKEYGSLEELKQNLPKADVYCSGSDQIWGKTGTEKYDKAYFLDFVPSNKKCIAYSSSFGKEKIEEDLDKELNELLNKYSKILVRESSAVDIIKKHGFNNVDLVLDPTLLLKKEEWEKLITTQNKYKDYILVYQLHSNKEFDKYAKEFAKRKGKKLLRISPSLYHVVRSGKLLWLPNISEFLMYFRDAKYILTDSFHATVFSIIFNKQFKCILPGATSTRITSILNLLGIDNRILQDYNDFESIDNVINYEKVNAKKEIEVERSLNLLQEAIEQ